MQLKWLAKQPHLKVMLKNSNTTDISTDQKGFVISTVCGVKL